MTETRSAEEAVDLPAAKLASEAPPSAGRKRQLVDRVRDTITYTLPQRRAMAVVLAGVTILLAWRVIRDRAFVPDPQPTAAINTGKLADRIDPNTASWEELVALPTLGEKRAKAIVAHREDWKTRHPNEPAFKNAVDLVVVKGIGVSMVETLSPFLAFPAPAKPAATAPINR